MIHLVDFMFNYVVTIFTGANFMDMKLIYGCKMQILNSYEYYVCIAYIDSYNIT